MADLEEKRIVDLSHVIEDGMTTYKGFPGPHICDFWGGKAPQPISTMARPSRSGGST